MISQDDHQKLLEMSETIVRCGKELREAYRKKNAIKDQLDIAERIVRQKDHYHEEALKSQAYFLKTLSGMQQPCPELKEIEEVKEEN